MGSKRIEWSLKLGEALIDYTQEHYPEALEKAQQAKVESASPEVKTLATYVAARAEQEICAKTTPPNADCKIAKPLLDEISNATVSCPNQESVFITIYGNPGDDESLGYDYDCATLHNAAKRFQEAKTKEFKHITNNDRPFLKKKFSARLKKEMIFTPDLFDGSHYLRDRVFNTYDAGKNQWISSPHDLKLYNTHLVATTHHYHGPIQPQNLFTPYYNDGDLFILPIPEGFALDAGGVRINGSDEGFDLLQDSDGIIYARLKDQFYLRRELEAEFDLTWNEEPSPSAAVPETSQDLLPEMALPKPLQDLKDQTQFYGTAEKVEAMRNFVLSQLKYPDMKAVLSGQASYPQENGREFYEGLSKMKWADCDVANGYGVVLLRKMGVPARLVTGYYIDERGVGLHGWLEYWDDYQKIWVRGDVTPPLVPSPKAIDPTGQGTSGGVTPAEGKVFPEFIPFHLNNKKRQENDLYWTFEGEGFLLSEPDGRYLMSSVNIGGALQVYDLEYDQFLSTSIPPCFPTGLHETFEGFQIETDCSDATIDTTGPFQLWDQNGNLLKNSERPFASKSRLKLGPDGSPDWYHSWDGVSERMIVVRGDKELYRYSLDHHARNQFRLHNDGSLDIKQIGSNKAVVIHVGPNGKEDEKKRIEYSLMPLGVGSEFSIEAVSWTGKWQREYESGVVDDVHDKSANQFYFNQKGDAVQVAMDNCIEKDDWVRCMDRREKIVYDPLTVRYKKYLYSPDLLPSQWKRLPRNLSWLPVFVRPEANYRDEVRDRYSAWDIVLREGDPDVQFGARQHVAVVVSVQDPIVLDLKEALKKEADAQSVRTDLAYLSQHPQVDIFHEWLLLGAAVLCNNYETCRNMDGTPGCEETFKETAQFLNQSGPQLAARLEPHVRESSYFKNQKVIAEGWAFLLAGASPSQKKKLIQKMLAADVDKAAEAIAAGLEEGLLAPDDIAPLSFVDEDLLVFAFKNILNRRKKIMIATMQNNQTLYAPGMLNGQYQQLEDLFVKRFGNRVIPDQPEKGW